MPWMPWIPPTARTRSWALTAPWPAANAVNAADPQDIAPGVRVLATAGHAPGHRSLLVTDPDGRDPRRLVVPGDVMHCQVQVAEPGWGSPSTSTPCVPPPRCTGS
jgi:glyoxylase-like metal-dependent hydrolase (beta-lactamase superfamily II)